MATAPQLVALGEGPNIVLDKPIVLIGRHQECDIQIPSRKISRRHCCLAQVSDHLVVRDLGSTNGIRVNGIKVNEGKLKSGDELVIGNFKYEVRLNGAPAGHAAPVGQAPAQGVAAGAPRRQLPPPPVPLPSPFDSAEEPVALREPDPLAPILPKNKSDAPLGAFPDMELDDVPHAIVPESMSLEPLSEDDQKRRN
ncbi:MAG: FHA domain-containing protein [Gemmataceae bacterium]